MHYLSHSVRKLLMLESDEASFQRRGFSSCTPCKRFVLENVGGAFIAGYNAAITSGHLEDVIGHVAGVSQAEKGFAIEGAAMGIAILDAFPFRTPLLPACIEAFRKDFTYLVHVGAGWSLARVPWRKHEVLGALDPIHKWLAFDGLGFHDTYFSYRRHADRRRNLVGYSSKAYDQGVGRGLWFIAGGSVADATGRILAHPAGRQSDLWSGLGLAMAYAGPVRSDDLVSTYQSAGPNAVHYAQGIAFACEARVQARHVPAHTDLAARVIWGVGAEAIAQLVRETRGRLPEADGEQPRYEVWRQDVAAAAPRWTDHQA